MAYGNSMEARMTLLLRRVGCGRTSEMAFLFANRTYCVNFLSSLFYYRES